MFYPYLLRPFESSQEYSGHHITSNVRVDDEDDNDIIIVIV
jgi:hypothetical protein